MLNAGGLTERVRVYQKSRTGTSPEQWEAQGGLRRADISRVSDRAALEESAGYDVTVTHQAYVDYADGVFEPIGQGGRIIKRESDGQNFVIVRAIGVGRRGRAGKQRYMRLSLTALSPAVV